MFAPSDRACPVCGARDFSHFADEKIDPDKIGEFSFASLSFSRLPLHLLTAFGGLSFTGAVFLALVTVFMRLFFPESVPRGITTILLVSLSFGSASILGLGILGEYIGKILEETKARPPFIRKHLITRGIIKEALSSKKKRQ